MTNSPTDMAPVRKSDGLIARTSGKNYFASHNQGGGLVTVSLVDEFGHSASITMGARQYVNFCRDSLTRIREAGTDIPE